MQAVKWVVATLQREKLLPSAEIWAVAKPQGDKLAPQPPTDRRPLDYPEAGQRLFGHVGKLGWYTFHFKKDQHNMATLMNTD